MLFATSPITALVWFFLWFFFFFPPSFCFPFATLTFLAMWGAVLVPSQERSRRGGSGVQVSTLICLRLFLGRTMLLKSVPQGKQMTFVVAEGGLCSRSCDFSHHRLFSPCGHDFGGKFTLKHCSGLGTSFGPCCQLCVVLRLSLLRGPGVSHAAASMPGHSSAQCLLARAVAPCCWKAARLWRSACDLPGQVTPAMPCLWSPPAPAKPASSQGAALF